jgi:hypothetical protein
LALCASGITGLAGSAAAAGVGQPAALAALEPGPSLSPAADQSWWGTNGRVADIVTRGNRAYLGGGFDYVGPTTGHGVIVDPATGQRAPGPIVDGRVNAVVADGNGGYYIGGDFVRVGTSRREGLAHILADGTVEKSWAPAVTGSVKALALVGGTLVFGGQFTAVGTQAAANLAAVPTTLNPVLAWSAPTNAPVTALAVAGDSVYVSGSFSTINANARRGLARMSGTTGALDTSFNVNVNTTGAVNAMAVRPGATRAEDLLYFGGEFSSVTAGTTSARSRLAAVSGANGLQGWAPAANATVRALALDTAAGRVAVGGLFSTLNGTARERLAVVDLAGALTGLNAQLSGCHAPHSTGQTYALADCTTEVNTVAMNNGTLYAAGVFTMAGGALKHNAAAFSLSDGSVSSWRPFPGNRVSSLTVLPSGVYLGGDFTSVGGEYRQGLAAIDLTTGQVDPTFVTSVDGMVLDIELNGDGTKLFFGGTFKKVDGKTRQRLASVNATTGAADPAFKPKINKDVRTIAVRGTHVYLGGQFTAINGTTRNRAARISAVDGAVDPAWVANTTGPSGTLRQNGMVQSLAVTSDGSRVFLGGPFTAVNGQAVTGGVIALSGVNGAVLPQRLGGVQRCGSVGPWLTRVYLSDDDQRLYGGDVCPDMIYQWDAVNLSTPTNPTGLKWMTRCNGGMQGRLEVNGHFYYGSHGGDEGNGGFCTATPGGPAVDQQRFYVFNSTTGALQDYAPQFDTPMGIWAFAHAPGIGLLVGGDFTFAGNRDTVQQGFALFRGTP